MNSPTTKKCNQCAATKNLAEEFGLNASSPDGYRSICNACRRDNRKAASTKDAQELKAHNRTVADAQKRLLHPETLTPGELKKLSDVVRLADKHREALQAKVQAAHAEQERATQLANAAPSLRLVQQHFGSHIFLTTEQMREKLAQARVALGNLTGPDDGPAAAHVEKYVEAVGYIVKQRDDLAAEMARDEQEALNEKVCRRVCGRLMDLYIPQIHAAATAEAKIALREKLRARKKSLMAMAKTATGLDKSGAEQAVVAKAVADALEKLIVNSLYAGTKDPLPTDTLENINSRQDAANAAQLWLETEEAKRQAYWQELKARDFRQWEKESKSLVLQSRGDGHFAYTQRKTMAALKREDPAEYERRALEDLKPRKVTQPIVVYVIQEGKRETWLWPSGKPVLRGTEVTYDARLKYWTLMPGPAGIEMDAVTAPGRQKMEWYQDEFDADEDGPRWKQRPEGSAGVYQQQNDGTFKRTDNPSPWTKPERLEFRRAEPPASAAHTELRHGKWFTQAEVDEAARADAANPPNLLPPLPKFAVADSLALPPPITAADRAKDSRIPYVWARHEQAEKERKAREAELLQGN